MKSYQCYEGIASNHYEAAYLNNQDSTESRARFFYRGSIRRIFDVVEGRILFFGRSSDIGLGEDGVSNL